MHIRRMKIKLVVVGERGVGKTSLIQRYVRNHFSPEYRGTLGAYMFPVDVEVASEGEIVQARVAIFDLMGEHSIREVFRDAMFYGTHGILAVCDVTRPDSLYALQEWVRAVGTVTGGVPFHVAMNKVDVAKSVALGPQETAWLRKEMPSARLVLTSAQTGLGVEEAFGGVLDEVIGGILRAGTQRRVHRIVRQKILALVVRRGSLGASKTDLLTFFKELEHNELMEEVDNLVRLGTLEREESGPSSFRVKATDRGREIAESTLWEELVIEDPS